MQTEPAGLPREFADRFTRPVRRFLQIESAAGVLLLIATLVALLISSSPHAGPISGFWETPVGFRFGPHEYARSVRHWINDALMTLFFFVVALELKRELARGELRDLRKAAFPLAGALGGMIVPPVIYVGMLRGMPETHGWGTAMTTDTAFVLGGLALLGKRIPVSLRVFLLSLAIFDDVGAILVVAVAYGKALSWPALAATSCLVVLVLIAARAGVRSSAVYLLAGAALWIAVDASGLHPSIAGVLLGLMTPAREWISGDRLHRILERVASHPTAAHPRDAGERNDLRTAGVAAKEAISPVERLELRMHPWAAFLVMPVFALANAGVTLTWERLAHPVSVAVAIALVLGKPAGVLTMTLLAVRARVATRPRELPWSMIAAASVLTGIGFTMSIFIASLAFDRVTLEAAKVGILTASVISGSVGLLALMALTSRGHTSATIEPLRERRA